MVYKRIPSLIVIVCIVTTIAESFVVPPALNVKDNCNIGFSMAKENDDEKKGYRFGDITRGLLKKSSSYKFGDISRWLDKKSKEQVSKFTKKEDYQFGDMSREVIRRLRDGEYSREDLWLFLRIVAAVGINLQPVASVLPLRVLTELLNMTMEASIAKTVGDKVVSSITSEIDARMKEMVTGDRNYELGDLTKRKISSWTGKDNYEFGDITKTILSKRADLRNGDASSEQGSESKKDETFELFSSKSKEEQEILEKWDEELLKARKQKEDIEPYQEWDKKFLSSS